MKERHDRANEWLHYAGEDLRSAEILFKEEIYSQTCFHAQQCVEKSLKAFLIFKCASFRKIHDLNELLEICLSNGGGEMKSFSSSIAELNMFYVPIRYPDGVPGGLADRMPDRKTAKAAFNSAEDIYNFITGCVPSLSSSKRK